MRAAIELSAIRTATRNGPLPLTYPVTLGSESVVEKLGPKTHGFAVGAEVFGATNPLLINSYGLTRCTHYWQCRRFEMGQARRPAINHSRNSDRIFGTLVMCAGWVQIR